MKLSISNIAWPREKEEAYLRDIRKLGCEGVEIAPSRIWPEPVDATEKDRLSFKSLVEGNGLEISAMQALLYTRRDLGLFREVRIEDETIDYLKKLCCLASDVGATRLVFGSPDNRRRGSLSPDEAFERAAEFFSKVASFAAERDVCICIEPLRAEETDFITTAQDGLRLVNMVGSPGLGLHLDAKAVAAEGKDFLQIFKSAVGNLRHFHINDPGLIEVNTTGSVDHASMARALREAGYNGYASIEMRTLPDYDGAVKRSVQFSKNTYLGSGV